MKQFIEEEIQPPPGTWMYHKELGAVLFHSKEEIELAGDGWQDNPTFEKPKSAKAFAPTKPFEKMTKVELIQACLSIDLKKDEIVSLKNKELIALLK